MTVYIEYVVIDNMTMNTLLLYAAFLTLRQKPRLWRVLLSALLGTLCALAMPLLKIPSWVSFILKIAVALLMTLVVLPKFKLKYYIMSNLIFVAYTFVLGGAILGLFYMTGTDFKAMSAFTYSATVPVGLYVVGVALFAELVFNVVRYISSAKKRSAFMRRVKLAVGGRTFLLNGYVDSGNLLESDGLPVCFVLDKRLSRFATELLAQSITLPSAKTDEKFKVIFYETVAGARQRAYAFKPDLFEVEDKPKEVYVALAGKKMRKGGQFDILLNSSLEE